MNKAAEAIQKALDMMSSLPKPSVYSGPQTLPAYGSRMTINFADLVGLGEIVVDSASTCAVDSTSIHSASSYNQVLTQRTLAYVQRVAREIAENYIGEPNDMMTRSLMQQEFNRIADEVSRNSSVNITIQVGGSENATSRTR